MAPVTPERRKFPRASGAPRFLIGLRQADALVPTTSVNVSEGGLCVRLRRALDVRSVVQLSLTPQTGRSPHPLACAGRVVWVVARQDLGGPGRMRYDVGLEFIAPPPALRQLLARSEARASEAVQPAQLPAALIRGRRYIPRLEREAERELSWHLIVDLEGNPCFSGRYATRREALQAWTQFQRKQARPAPEAGARRRAVVAVSARLRRAAARRR